MQQINARLRAYVDHGQAAAMLAVDEHVLDGRAKRDNRPPPYPDPFISFLIDDELASLARTLFMKTSHQHAALAMRATIASLDMNLFPRRCKVRSCRSMGRPVCLCWMAPLSEDKCILYLLSGV